MSKSLSTSWLQTTTSAASSSNARTRWRAAREQFALPMKPIRVALHKKSRVLELVYENGEHFALDAEFLRVYSPSAEVRGHHPSQAVLQHGKQHVAIEKISAVGSYALQLHFDDGHNSGLYSWDYLRELGEQHDRHWQEYLDKLHAAGLARDPDLQTVSVFDPKKPPAS